MTSLVELLLLSALALLAMSLRRVYGQAPLKEIKRRVNQGDKTAQGLYLVAHHGMIADRFLLTVAAISAAFAAVIVSRTLDLVGAVIFVVGLSILLFLPLEPRKFHPAHSVAQILAPYLGRLLARVRPTIQKINRNIKKNQRPAAIHTKIYEKEDLATVIEAQKLAVNNRIEQAELDILLHALIFGEKKVKDHMTPRRVVRFVGRDEPIGPVLMDELHDSGFSRFPVTGNDENEVVGTLYFKDLVERKKPGLISNVMSPAVYYVSEDAPLGQVLDAFIKTKHHLFIAVNELEEVVGLITIEDVIEQIIGRRIVDEFDKYDDMRAVAELHAKKDQAKHSGSKVVK